MGQVKRSAAYPSQTSQQPHALQPALHSSQRLRNVLMFPSCVRQIAFPLLSLPSSGMYLPFNSTEDLRYIYPVSIKIFTKIYKISIKVGRSFTVNYFSILITPYSHIQNVLRSGLLVYLTADTRTKACTYLKPLLAAGNLFFFLS